MFGVDQFKLIFEKYRSRPILLYGDPDVDGLISLLLMCQWCDLQGLRYEYHVNGDRYHGFLIEAEVLRGYMVIASDFSITEVELRDLVDHDVVVLSTDHHEVGSKFLVYSGETADGVVINNQYEFECEEDKYLSGAGVFYEVACEVTPGFHSRERDALVGITLLSDVRQIENRKAREYLRCTYTADVSCGYFKYLIDCTLGNDYGFGRPRLDRNYIDYTLSPTINALLRFDRTDEAVSFILGGGLRSNNLRERQKEVVLWLESRAVILELDHFHALAVRWEDFMGVDYNITNFVGLMCSDYKDKHGGVTTIGVVLRGDEILRASCRGRYDDVNYRLLFTALGIEAVGHATAFGIKNFRPMEDTWLRLDVGFKDLERGHRCVKVIEVTNLMSIMVQCGGRLAEENCYVRDMYRTYLRYTGSNIKIKKKTYKFEEFSDEDYACGRKPDMKSGKTYYKHMYGKDGEMIIKYIEYLIDGQLVKSFGVRVEDGMILPILDKGYVQLYVRNVIG